MESDDRQFLKTVAWMFMRHGRPNRAFGICEALCEDDPRDSVAAVAFAELLLDNGDPSRAIEVIHAADIPNSLAHVAAVLETRALCELGRATDASARWRRYLESKKGAARQWVAQP